MKATVTIGVPFDSVGRGGGTETAPRNAARLGKPEALGARDEGDLAVRIRGEARDPVTGLLASADVLASTTSIRAAVAATLSAGRAPLPSRRLLRGAPGALAGARDGSARWSASPISTATSTSTTARLRPPARPPTCRSRWHSGSGRRPGSPRRAAPPRSPAHRPDRLPRPRRIGRRRHAPAGGPGPLAALYGAEELRAKVSPPQPQSSPRASAPPASSGSTSTSTSSTRPSSPPPTTSSRAASTGTSSPSSSLRSPPPTHWSEPHSPATTPTRTRASPAAAASSAPSPARRLVALDRDEEAVPAWFAGDAFGAADAVGAADLGGGAVGERRRGRVERRVAGADEARLAAGATVSPWPKSTSLGQLNGRGGGDQSRLRMSQRAPPSNIAQPMLPEGLRKVCRWTTGASILSSARSFRRRLLPASRRFAFAAVRFASCRRSPPPCASVFAPFRPSPSSRSPSSSPRRRSPRRRPGAGAAAPRRRGASSLGRRSRGELEVGGGETPLGVGGDRHRHRVPGDLEVGVIPIPSAGATSASTNFTEPTKSPCSKLWRSRCRAAPSPQPAQPRLDLVARRAMPWRQPTA